MSRIMSARLNKVPNVPEPQKPSTSHPSPTSNHPSANYYSAWLEQDPFPDPSLLDSVDADQHSGIKDTIMDMVARATTNGLLEQFHKRLEKLVYRYIDIFRIGLSSGPPARLPAMKISVTPEAKPVKERLRNYSQEQRKFLADFVSSLVSKGMDYRNPTCPWASAPLLVPRTGPAKFRFTVDLRPVNKYTVKHNYPMPNLEQEVTKLAGSCHYARFDLSNRCWQLALDKKSQSLQPFITPDGVFTPTRVLHGTTNAVTHLQSSL